MGFEQDDDETAAMKAWQCLPDGAARWNEKIRIDPMKLPPRTSKEEPHCRWKVALTHERVDYAADPATA